MFELIFFVAGTSAADDLRARYVSGEIDLEDLERRLGAAMRADDWGWTIQEGADPTHER